MIDDTCNKPYCNEPKHRQANGKAHQFCHHHMREYWREKAKERAERLETEGDPKPKRKYQKRQPAAPRGYAPAEQMQQAVKAVRDFERCPVCHRTPEAARTKAQQGITCSHCRGRLHEIAQPAATVRIVRVNYKANCLDVLDGATRNTLPMPDTEGELNALLDQYADSGCLVVR